MKKFPHRNRSKETAVLAGPLPEEHARGIIALASTPTVAGTPDGLAERIRRIGAILKEAISLAWMDGLLPASASTRPLRFPKDAFAGTTLDERILVFLEKHGPASPKDIILHFSTSPSSVRRALARMVLQGAVSSRGNTRALTYSAIQNRRAAA